MDFYSLLDSYGYLVYENKKVLKKSFPKNIFSSDEKISVEKIWHFFWKSNFYFEISKNDFSSAHIGTLHFTFSFKT